MSWMDDMCNFCLHSQEDHEMTPDKRIPKAVENGRYVCGDCVACDMEQVSTHA
jgi:hypothetical protein